MQQGVVSSDVVVSFRRNGVRLLIKARPRYHVLGFDAAFDPVERITRTLVSLRPAELAFRGELGPSLSLLLDLRGSFQLRKLLDSLSYCLRVESLPTLDLFFVEGVDTAGGHVIEEGPFKDMSSKCEQGFPLIGISCTGFNFRLDALELSV